MAKRAKIQSAASDTALTLAQWREREGLESEEAFYEYMESASDDAVCACLCTEGCEAECDGSCEHGHRSVMLAAGVI